MKTIVLFILLFLLEVSLVAADMTLVFDTTKSYGTEIALPLNGSVNVTVYWGDGTSDPYTTAGNKSHIYTSDSTYTVTISGTLTQFGNGAYSYTGSDKLIQVTDFGTIGLQSLSGAFNGCSNLTAVASNFPSQVTNTSYMFYYATSFNQNINGWDVSSVTNMSHMFREAATYNQDMNSWDVSGVIDMSYMFYDAVSFNGDITSWNVSSVTDMKYMFSGARIFNRNIGSWNVISVTDMTGMFDGAPAFNQNIGGWNVSNVTNMNSMFRGARIFNQNIGNWNVGNVTTMNSMFDGAESFNQFIGSWVVDNVTDMARMFFDAKVFNKDIGSWDVGNVIDMNSMFAGARDFNSNISGWNVSNVKNMSNMFNSATSFNQNIGGWNVGNVTNMYSMFYNAIAFNGNIGTWDVSSVTDMRFLFYGASTFNQNIGGWNVGNVTDMSYMFYHATSFDQNLGNWNVSNVSNMSEMFDGVTLSTTNYDALLNGWATLTLQNNVTFDAGNSKYSSNGEDSRQSIIDDYNWTIIDGGKDTTLPVIFTSFTAIQTIDNYAKLTWITQSENGISGYNVYRNSSDILDDAVKINGAIIEAANTSVEHEYNFTDENIEYAIENFYWIETVSLDGSSKFYGPVSIKISPSHQNDTPNLILSTRIQTIYPNPFNPSITIEYYLNADTNVDISVYNIRGQLINSLVSNFLPKGEHRIVWNGNYLKNREISSGIYIIKFKTEEQVQTKAVSLIK